MGQMNVVNAMGSLPSGYCWPSSPQTYANDIVALITSYVNGEFSSLVMSESAPDSDYNDLPWIKVDSSNSLIGLFTFSADAAAWARTHPIEASSDVRQIWVGSEADLKTYDGGEDTTVTVSTGPFWEIDTDFEFRFPLGVGTSPGGTAVAVGQTGGEEEHTLTVAELPEHTHDAIWDKQDADGGGQLNFPYNGTDHDAGEGEITRATESTGDGDAHSIMPPYRGVYFIKRTARIFIRG